MILEIPIFGILENMHKLIKDKTFLNFEKYFPRGL